MNIQAFSMISAAYINPTAYGDLHGANYWVWLLSHVLADEKFISIFSMLFGAGIYLMTSRIEAAGKRSAALHYRRMGWLILFGLLHGYLLWSGDILFHYGMCGLVVYLFRKRQPKTLLVLGLLLVAVAPALTSIAGWTTPRWPPGRLQELREQMWQPPPERVTEEVTAYRGGWLAQMKARVPDSLQMDTVYLLSWGLWREGGLMLAGMALFKLGVFSGKRSARLYSSMIALAVLVGIPITLYGTHRDFAAGWAFPRSLFFGMQYNYWASLLVSFGWVGLVMLAVRVAALAGVVRRLAAVGRMAFSNYIMHTLICTTIFYGHGFGLFGKVERVGQFAIVVAIWALQLTISPIWFRYFFFGPLEWLWRSLTYLRREPFRRTASVQG